MYTHIHTLILRNDMKISDVNYSYSSDHTFEDTLYNSFAFLSHFIATCGMCSILE